AARRPAGSGPLAPRTDLERAVATLWEEVLGRSGVGLRDSFWELGGHSLLATKVLARVAKTFAIELPFDSLFRCPVLEDFALLIEQQLLSGEVEEEEEDLPLVAR